MVSKTFACGDALLSFDRGGGIARVDRSDATSLWRGSMGGFVYQTVDKGDYAVYGSKYGGFTACDVPPSPDNGNCQSRVKLCKGSSFVKVNVSAGSPVHRNVKAVLEELWVWGEQSQQSQQSQQQQQQQQQQQACRFLLKSSLPREVHDIAGAPLFVWSNITVSSGAAATAALEVVVELTWVNKSATKLPEALWVRFTPDDQFITAEVPLSSPLSPLPFTLEAQKLGRYVDALDVVHRGAVNFFPADAMRLSVDATNASVTVSSLDAAFAGIGKPWPFPVRVSEQPEGAPDFSYNLFNNIWGTNVSCRPARRSDFALC